MIVIFAAFVLRSLSFTDPNVLPLQLFEKSTGALCIDGSVAGFHGRNGSKTSLLISLPGGGWCWDGPTCSNRAQTTLGSMTKYIEARGHTLHVGPVGEMSALPSGNPYFWNFTAVSPVYCDGTNFAGTVDRPFDGSLLHLRGRKILQTLLDVVLVQWGMADTLEQVVLTGCSAGGTGTYFNVDFVHNYVQDRLNHQIPLRTRAFGNAGWFMDTNSDSWNGDAWAQVPGIQRAADRALFSYAGLAASLSAQCQTSFSPANESWKCAMAQYLFPFIAQPTLVLQSSYDLNQLVTGGPRCISLVGPLANLSGCSAAQIEQMSVYGDALNATMAIARHAAVFAPTCAIHCYTAYWTTIAIGHTTMADAIGRFVSSPHPSGMLWFDSCRGPNCNPTCPRMHGGD